MATMFGSIVANVLYPLKQLLLDVANLMTGSLADLLAATAGVMEALEDIIEKTIGLLTG